MDPDFWDCFGREKNCLIAKEMCTLQYFQIAERAIQKLSALDISDLDLQIPTQIEEARLYWSRSEENIAKHLMRHLIDRLRKVVRLC